MYNVLHKFLICYIFRLSFDQNKKALGLSKEARHRRRQRNIISMKFNIINWTIETLTILLSSSVQNR